MGQRAKIYTHNKFAGILEEHDDGKFTFTYDTKYLSTTEPKPISLTLPIIKQTHESETLFPFFDGLIPEGWLLNIAVKNWKLDARNRMELLLKTCSDCIGSVHVQPYQVEDAK